MRIQKFILCYPEIEAIKNVSNIKPQKAFQKNLSLLCPASYELRLSSYSQESLIFWVLKTHQKTYIITINAKLMLVNFSFFSYINTFYNCIRDKESIMSFHRHAKRKIG